MFSTGEPLSVLGAESQSAKTLPIGSISVSCIDSVGIVSIIGIKAQTNQQINSVAQDSDMDREFLYFSVLGLKEIIQMYASSGATMSNLSKGKFESLRIICPRKNLVSIFHDTVFPMFELIKSSQKKIGVLRQTRDLLLSRLISGELDVSELDIETARVVA